MIRYRNEHVNFCFLVWFGSRKGLQAVLCPYQLFEHMRIEHLNQPNDGDRHVSTMNISTGQLQQYIRISLFHTLTNHPSLTFPFLVQTLHPCSHRSSSGAPISIGWKPINESVIDLDFYEYCRIPERKSRKKMILSVRRRANV